MTYGLYHQALYPRRQALLPFFFFSLNRLRQVVAIPEEAILRRAMIGSHAANEREKKNPDHESESIFSVS